MLSDHKQKVSKRNRCRTCGDELPPRTQAIAWGVLGGVFLAFMFVWAFGITMTSYQAEIALRALDGCENKLIQFSEAEGVAKAYDGRHPIMGER